MEKTIPVRMTEGLYEQMTKAIEVHEKRTNIAMSMSDFIRAAISEKILKGR